MSNIHRLGAKFKSVTAHLDKEKMLRPNIILYLFMKQIIGVGRDIPDIVLKTKVSTY